MTEKKKALVVDDEEIVRELFSRLLNTEDFQVDTAKDGSEAVQKAAGSSFNLIFMDVKMPGINGVETFKKIRALDPGAAVFMMTGFAVEKEVEEAISLGARGCLKKPFDIDEIIKILRKAR